MQQEDIAVASALFFDQINACDTKVNGALPHADDDVTRTLEDDAQVRKGRHFRLVLSRVGFENAQAGGSQKIESIAFEWPS